MSVQELAAYALVAAAAAYLVARRARRRASGNCCGQTECPAAKAAADRIREGLGKPP